MNGNRLKQLRIDKGLSQQELADLIGVNRTTIGKYELKNVTPNIDVLKKMSAIFNTTESFLMGFSENDPSKKNDFSPEDLELLRQIKQASPEKQLAIELILGIKEQAAIEYFDKRLRGGDF